MLFETESTNELPAYEYVPIGINVKIRIYKLDRTETVTDEDENTYTRYIYKTNEFTVLAGEITEEEIAANPERYLLYTIPEYSTEERISAIEEAIDFILMGGV